MFNVELTVNDVFNVTHTFRPSTRHDEGTADPSALCTDRCMAMSIHMRIDTRIDVRIDIFIDISTHMCIGTNTHMHIDMGANIDMGTDMWTELCMDMRWWCVHAHARTTCV